MHKHESCSDENNDGNQQNDGVDGSVGNLDYSFHGTSLGIKKVHAKTRMHFRGLARCFPGATLHFKRLFYAPSGFCQGLTAAGLTAAEAGGDPINRQ